MIFIVVLIFFIESINNERNDNNKVVKLLLEFKWVTYYNVTDNLMIFH